MLREIAARLGVQIDDKQLTGFMGALDVAKEKLGHLAHAFIAVAGLHFIEEQVAAAAALGVTAERVGVTTDELQLFQFALMSTGASAEDAERAIFIFNKTVGAATEGTMDANKKFAEMGIKLKDGNGHARSMVDLLPEVADKVAEAGSAAEQTAIAVNFFGKSGLKLIPLLKRGREGVAELSAEFEELGGGVSADVIENSRHVMHELHSMELVTKNLAIEGIGALLVVLMPLAKWLLHTAANVRGLIQHTNAFKVGLALVAALLAVKLIPMVWGAVQALTAMRVTILGTSLPFLLVAAAVAVLFLVLEDLFTLVTGGDSLIGKLLDSLLGIGTSKKVVDAIKDSWLVLQAVWMAVKEDFGKGLALNWELLKKDIGAIIAFFKEAIAAKNELFGQTGKREVKGSEADKLLHPENAVNGGGNVGGIATNTFGQSDKALSLLSGGSLFDAAYGGNKGYLPNLAGGGVKVQNQNNQTSVVVNVPPGTSPAAVVPAVKDGVAAGVSKTLADAHGALATFVDAPGGSGF